MAASHLVIRALDRRAVRVVRGQEDHLHPPPLELRQKLVLVMKHRVIQQQHRVGHGSQRVVAPELREQACHCPVQEHLVVDGAVDDLAGPSTIPPVFIAAYRVRSPE